MSRGIIAITQLCIWVFLLNVLLRSCGESEVVKETSKPESSVYDEFNNLLSNIKDEVSTIANNPEVKEELAKMKNYVSNVASEVSESVSENVKVLGSQRISGNFHCDGSIYEPYISSLDKVTFLFVEDGNEQSGYPNVVKDIPFKFNGVQYKYNGTDFEEIK